MVVPKVIYISVDDKNCRQSNEGDGGNEEKKSPHNSKKSSDGTRITLEGSRAIKEEDGITGEEM